MPDLEPSVSVPSPGTERAVSGPAASFGTPVLAAVDRQCAPPTPTPPGWRGTFSEALRESERASGGGQAAFVSADWERQGQARVMSGSSLATIAETLSAGQARPPVYGVRPDGTVHNTVTGRDEYLRLEAGREGYPPRLQEALERHLRTSPPGAPTRDLHLEEKAARERLETEMNGLVRRQMRGETLSAEDQTRLTKYDHERRARLDAAGVDYVVDRYGNARVVGGRGPYDAIDLRGLSAEEALKQVAGPYQVIVSADAQVRTVPDFVQHLALTQNRSDKVERTFGSLLMRDRFGFALGVRSGSAAELRGGELANWDPQYFAGSAHESTRFYGAQEAAKRFHQANWSELEERYQVFTPAGTREYKTWDGSKQQVPYSVVTRTVDGVERQIEVVWAPGHANSAVSAGVQIAEARAKVNWLTYRAVLDAGLATPGVETMTINSVWRPFTSETSMHPYGRGLDVNAINGVFVNDRGHTQPGQGLDQPVQPAIVEAFSRRLKTANPGGQVIQPWMTDRYPAGADSRTALGDGFTTNAAGPGLPGATPLEKKHLDHIHFTLPPELQD